MLGTRFERVERLRAELMDAPAMEIDLATVAGGDAAAVQSAWASFVPFLAHPVMAPASQVAMGRLDATVLNGTRTTPVAA